MTNDPVAEQFAGLMDGYGLDTVPGSRQPRRPATPTPSAPSSPGEEWRVHHRVVRLSTGDTEPLYTITAVAKALGVATITVRKWQAEGYMPPSGIRLSGYKRNGKPASYKLWTEAQVKHAVEVFADMGLLGAARVDWRRMHPAVSLRLIAGWAPEAKRVKAQ